jgi:hypothetical protein
MNNKGENKNSWLWIVLVIAGIYLVSTGTISIGGQKTTETTTTDGASQTSGCSLLNAPTITPYYQNAYTFASVTASHPNVYVNGATVSDTDGAFNSVAGQPYRLLSNASGYYNSWTTGTTKCQSDEPVTIGLYQNGTATVTMYNADDQPTTAQAVGTEDSKNFKFKISAPKSQCFGNPQAKDVDSKAGIIIGLDYNTTLYKSVTVDKVLSVSTGVNGAAGNAVKVSVPQQYVGTFEEAYQLPVSSVCDLGEIKGIGTISSKASMDPSTTDDPTAYFLDVDIFKQIRSDQIVAGAEDSDGNDKGFSNPTLDIKVA